MYISRLKKTMLDEVEWETVGLEGSHHAEISERFIFRQFSLILS